MSFPGAPTFRRPPACPTTWNKLDRKSTRLNSSHLGISYAVFCLKKKSIIGYALEAATGTPYRELLRTHVLGPMGLEDTEPELTVHVRHRLAVGYDRLHHDRHPSP